MKIFLSVSLNDLLPSGDINEGIEQTSKGLRSVFEQIMDASRLITALLNSLPEWMCTILYISIAIGIIIGIIKLIVEVV